MEQITADELLQELQALGLGVHVELATQRIINRRLQARLTPPEPPKTEELSGVAAG